jgi:hypothetical protein
METARYVYRVETRKVKIVFVSIAVFVFIVFLMAVIFCPEPPGVSKVSSTSLKVKDDMVLAIFPLCTLVVLWSYGKWRVFGFEWHLHDDGLRIYKNHCEVR